MPLCLQKNSRKNKIPIMEEKLIMGMVQSIVGMGTKKILIIYLDLDTTQCIKKIRERLKKQPKKSQSKKTGIFN